MAARPVRQRVGELGDPELFEPGFCGIRAEGSGEPLELADRVFHPERLSVLLEDFILREKITHFDHERIPERIVHARGSAAHGFFECYEPLTHLTQMSIFAEAGKRTPTFVRFSTVAGERGSTDTARDVRGFAVKFYTDEGNFDLVGNNIPPEFVPACECVACCCGGGGGDPCAK